MEDLIGYDDIIESSMRHVIYKILKKVEKEGLKGGHHFIISFAVKYPGVIVPKHLEEKFPEDVTIVIQHQFSSLLVGESEFKISLSFSGVFEKLTIPYLSIISFADPSINFGLKFNKRIPTYNEVSDDSSIEDLANVDLSAKIISLDAFRKNRDNKE
jgi:uncharacterized protein